MLDFLAWLILLTVWIFGGAAMFDSDRTEYKTALLGWSLLNALVVAITLIFLAALWALGRLYT